METATCPYCKFEFSPEDHHQSGEYDCPSCLRSIWIEVDYTVVYSTHCKYSEHQWKEHKSEIHPNTKFEVCSNCDDMRVAPDKENS